jgi:hypothetical protein
MVIGPKNSNSDVLTYKVKGGQKSKKADNKVKRRTIKWFSIVCLWGKKQESKAEILHY